MAARMELALFGACAIRVHGDDPIEITGAKHRALIILLACAPLGRRTRAYLQQTLWGDPGYDSGHQNLRRALADLRKMLGPDFDRLFRTTKTDVELDMDYVRLSGGPEDGVFLDGLAIEHRAFQDWLTQSRRDPEHIAAFFRAHRPARRPKPRVGVLPLLSLGGENLPVLGDWVAQELSRALSRSNLVMVISHLSNRAAVQSSPVERVGLRDLRDDLDVDYVLTGSLRADGERLVADVEFIDALSGEMLWTRQFTAPHRTFTQQVQGDLASVVAAMGRSMADAAIGAIQGARVAQIDGHHLTMAGVSLMHRPTLRDFLKAREVLEEASARSPRDADLHAWLGKWFILSVFNGWTVDRAGDIARALDCTARSLDLDPEGSFGLTIDGFAQNNLKQDLTAAAHRFDAALRVNPNESLSWLLRGMLDAFQDDGAAAIHGTETARRLSPMDPFGYFYDSLASSAHAAAEDYGRALELADQSLARNNRHISTLRVRIMALHYLGRSEEARAAATDLMRRQPDFRLDQYRSQHPSSQHKVGARVLEALQASGIA